VGNEGGYVTRGRAGQLERRMSALEATTKDRLDRLERDVAAVRAVPLDMLREQTRALLEVFSRHAKGDPQ
jgi:hypothetical protein